MACCYPDECGEYTVTPVLVATPYTPGKCAIEPPPCFPCLPPCPKGKIMYCVEKDQPKAPPRTPNSEGYDCCQNRSRQSSQGAYRQRSPPPPPSRQSYSEQRNCPNCSESNCKPVKTKYVIPCYRYEDGRIEQYVPTRHGRLPKSAYSRNGMQDQIHGYRGAVRYLCAGETPEGCSIVHTAIEPLRLIYPKITMEMLPIKRKKDKK